MNTAKQNRMRIAREARAENVNPATAGTYRLDETDPNRLLVNSDEIRWIQAMTGKVGNKHR